MNSYVLRNLRFPVCREFSLEDKVAAKLRLPPSAFRIAEILRRNVDTRRFNHPIYDYTLRLEFAAAPPRHADLAPSPALQTPEAPSILVSDPQPLIAGMGPAGLFCALALVKNGLRPILFDRGDPLAERAERVNNFWSEGLLDPESNVQFGEGGAGAFSDGKLTSRGNDPAIRQVFVELQRFGAPPEIAWEALPHLGTDGIRAVVRDIREYLLDRGCQLRYRSALNDLELREGKVARARFGADWLEPEILILGIGNAARDSFRLLQSRGVALEPKSFALGFRIEQKQADVNRIVYGPGGWEDILGPASYRLTAPTGFTFCMCPGGQVIAAASEPGTSVTNGMSYASRGAGHCNSAVVTPVGKDELGGGLWAGLELQEQLEKAAFRAGFLAPAQSAEAFLSQTFRPEPLDSSYRPGIVGADLSALFSPSTGERLRSALLRCNEILPGFSASALLIAPETRTSSPLRITRHQTLLHSLSAANLFPIGEGSGYAGGIMSSAADGWRLGERIRLRG